MKFFSKIQGALSLGIAATCFLALKSGEWVRCISPTSGTYDMAVLQGILLGVLAYLCAVWMAWLILQAEWPTLDRYIDFSQWAQDWRVIRPEHRVWFLAVVWAILFGGAITCLLAWR